MTAAISTLDWIVIGSYLLGLLGLAVWLARGQHNREDYYVGGRHVGTWPVAISVLATQCSTNSILGAPAFVAFSVGGGLVWLQYELALPLAAIVLLVWIVPVFRQLELVSVYDYLERRFSLATRLTVSGLFLWVRVFATAVTVYSIALVIELITGLSFFWSVMLLGAFTVLYDMLGGIRGVIYSDVLQLGLLVGMLLLLLLWLLQEQGGLGTMLNALPAERRQTLVFDAWGVKAGETFAFWPMLGGGLFLYMAYYGCDQSQTQRILSTRSVDAAQRAVFLNGLLRFPLVLLYCLIGVGIAAHAHAHPEFIQALPNTAGEPQYNLAVPLYMLQQLPPGLVGLGLVALFAAAMSSLDSVINSLSATTMEDFVRRFRQHPMSPERELNVSRLLTLIWGIVALVLAFQVGDIAPTVLEAINKIGSLTNGVILAVFIAGLGSRRITATAILIGFVSGFGVNLACWLWLPTLSWLWWNVIGFGVTLVTAFTLSRHLPIRWQRPALHVSTANRRRVVLLALWCIILIALLIWLQG